MIKLEHVVLASPEQMGFIIQGMRNPMNSWDKSDSGFCGGNKHIGCAHCSFAGNEIHNIEMCKMDRKYGFGIKPCGKKDFDGCYCIGHDDHFLMQRLSEAGTDHRKYMRMMPVYARITAPLYWLKEFDAYKVGTVANSCSTMHKIGEKEFTLDDFSCEHLDLNNYDLLNETIVRLNHYRDIYIDGGIIEYSDCRRQIFKPKSKKIWWQMIQMLPSSYNQTRNVMMNYEVLANIYKSRKNHKLDEWREFCKWIETLPYSELICGEDNMLMPMTPNEKREFCSKDNGYMTPNNINTIVDNSRGTGLWQPGDDF